MLQLDLLHSSFEQVRGQKEDFAAAFYNRLFTKFPQTQPLFASTDMKQQHNVLMAALGMVINALRNGEQEQLASVLRELGHRHRTYGVNPEHYQMVAAALLETFADFFGSAWTRELHDAWTEAYGAIVSLMLPSSTPQHPLRPSFITRVTKFLTRVPSSFAKPEASSPAMRK
jgi:nitric oxide dioxygenase